jgi:hypothetical protein
MYAQSKRKKTPVDRAVQSQGCRGYITDQKKDRAVKENEVERENSNNKTPSTLSILQCWAF